MDETQPSQPPHSLPNEQAVSAPPRPTWALVIGIIAIVIASMGIVTYGLCTPASTIVSGIASKQLGDVQDKAPQMAPTAAQAQVTWKYAPLAITNGCVIAVLGVLLLAGGIGLVRMRPWARSALLWWAALRLVALVPGSIIGWIVNNETFKAMEEAAQTSGGSTPGASIYALFTSPAWTVGTVAMGALFVVILPAFTLWWFNRRCIRESMALWPKPVARA